MNYLLQLVHTVLPSHSYLLVLLDDLTQQKSLQLPTNVDLHLYIDRPVSTVMEQL